MNREALEKLIREIDGTDCESRQDLYRKVSERYNLENKEYDPISPVVVGLRVTEWEIELKTAGGRRVEVDKDKLLEIVGRLNGTCNPSEMYKRAGEEYGGISGAVVAARCREWGVEVVGSKKNLVEEKAVSVAKFRDYQDEIDKWVACSAAAFGQDKNLIIAPAGPCPVKLDMDNIPGWVDRVVEAGQLRGKLFTVPALQYFVRQFHAYQSPEYGLAKEKIRAYVLEMASGVV